MLKSFIQTLGKSWWIIAICTGISLICGAVYTFRLPNIYMARGSIMVQPPSRPPKYAPSVWEEEVTGFYGTQIRLMQRKELIRRAREKLKDYEKTLASVPPVDLTVRREKDASLFILEVTCTSPEYARRYLQVVMDEFIAYGKSMERGYGEDNVMAILIAEKERLEKERRQIQEKIVELETSNPTSSPLSPDSQANKPTDKGIEDENGNTTELQRLKSKLKQTDEIYQAFIKQFDEIQESSRCYEAVRISMIEPAFVSPVPIGPNRFKHLLVSGLIGAVTGMLIVVVGAAALRFR